MRRLVSVVFVFALLLRSLMGVAMAHAQEPEMQVTAAPSSLQVMEAHPVHPSTICCDPTGTTTGSACEANPPGACAVLEHGPACQTCGACHSALWALPLPLHGQLSPSPAVLQPAGATRFASMLLVPALKPPIA